MSDQKTLEDLSIWPIIWPIILFTLSMAFIQVVIFILTQTVILFLLFLTYIGSFFFLRNHLQQKNVNLAYISGAYEIDREIMYKLGPLTLLIWFIALSSLLFILSFQSGLFSLLLLFFPLLLGFILSQSITSAIILFFTGTVIVPLVEEWFFRGVLLNVWSEKYSNKKAVFWTSFFFALLYLPAPILLIPRFLIGLLSGLSYIKTKKLVYPILIHGGMNILLLLPVLITSISPTTVFTEEVILLLGFSLLLSSEISPTDFRFVAILSTVFLVTLPAGILGLIVYGKNLRKERTPYRENANRTNPKRNENKTTS